MGGSILLELSQHEGTVVVVVVGTVDLYGGLELRDRLHSLVAEGHRRITVDFTAATFLDTTGLAPLVDVLKRLQAGNGEMRIVGAGDRARNLFRVRGLHDVLVVDESKARAGDDDVRT